MSVSACRDDDRLCAFLLGRGTEADDASIESHLAVCPGCLSRLQRLRPVDGLVRALRGHAADEPGQPEPVEALLRRLQPLCVEAASAPTQPETTDPSAALALDTSDVPAAAPPQAPPSAVGRYRLLRRLGAGGMGTVYLAHDPQLAREVAVKLPRLGALSGESDPLRQRFLREARAAAAVRHPHVCPIHDVGEHAGQPYVVMDYVEGCSLADRLHSRGRFEEAGEAVELVRQAAEALQAVHEHGLIHRDLKPGNILLDARGRAVLTDFGLARPEAEAERLTGSGMVVGTPAYMAPEQVEAGLHPVSARSDIYSLGVVLYQLLTGRLPFAGSALTVLRAIGRQPPVPPEAQRADLDPALAAIIRKAMARNPDERYARATDLATALGDWLAADRARKAQGGAGRPGKPGRRRLLPWLCAGAAAAALAAGLLLAGGVFRAQTPHGVLEVRSDDDDVQIVVKRNGEQVQIIDVKQNRVVEVLTGDIELELIDNGKPLQLKTNSFSLDRDERRIVEVVRLGPPEGARAEAPPQPEKPPQPRLDWSPDRPLVIGPEGAKSEGPRQPEKPPGTPPPPVSGGTSIAVLHWQVSCDSAADVKVALGPPEGPRTWASCFKLQTDQMRAILISQLSAAGLKVTPQEQLAQVQGNGWADPQAAGKQLGVRFVLTCEAKRNVRADTLFVKLIDVQSGQVLYEKGCGWRARDAQALTDVRQLAQDVIAKIYGDGLPPPVGAANPDLEKAGRLLSRDEPAARLEGVELLAREKPVGAPALLCRLLAVERDDAVKRAAVVALREVRPDLYPHVSGLLFDEGGQVLERHLQNLRQMGGSAAAVAPIVRARLQRCLDEAGAGPVRDAGEAQRLQQQARDVQALTDVLLQIDPASPETFTAITKVMAADRPHLRHIGVPALGNLCQKRREVREAAVRLLVPLLSAPPSEAGVVLSAVDALQQCGPDARVALPELKKLLTHSNAGVRSAADRAIREIEK
jgi:hypothetical protein